MPNTLEAEWKVFKERGKFQVRKLKPDGSKGACVGEPHDTYEDADKHRKALYANSPDMKADTIDETTMNSANLMLGAIHFEADELNPRILHFKDVVLARPEVNKNRDGVDATGIQELAASIALMPIDVGHQITKNIGTFTAGRVGENGELRVDGIIWLDRCDEMGVDPNDVLAGDYGLSIEADALTAECDKCHKVFASADEYCEHIRIQGNDMGIRSKLRHGANRIMHGLKSIGGAFTRKPAGSGTGWDSFSAMSFIASHQELTMSNDDTNELESIDKREDVSPADKKRAESEYGDVQYADEENKKYPIDTEEHVRAALAYLSMPKNADKYSSEEVTKMMSKIKHAAKKFGIEVSEPKNKEQAEMADKPDEKETPEEEKTETPKDEKKEEEMKAEYEAMKAEMTAKLEAMTAEKADAEQKLQAANTQLAEANQQLKAHRVAELKSKFVASIMDEEEFAAKADWLASQPDESIELMTRNRNQKPTEQQRMTASMDQVDTVVPSLF